MHNSFAKLAKGALAGAVCVSLSFCATGVVLAGPHEKTTATSAPRTERTTSAPRAVERSAPAPVQRTYTAPRAVERTYTAPRPVERTYTAPRPVERTYTAPRPVERTYTAPRAVERTYTAPRSVQRTYTAPRAVERTYTAPRSVQRTYTAPRAVERTYTAPRNIERTYNAPRNIERTYTAPRNTERTYTAPRSYERVYSVPRGEQRQNTMMPRSFERTYIPQRTREGSVQHVSPYRARTRDREIVTSPLVRAVYASRPATRETIVYHPAYLTGRVVRVTRNEVVLAPPSGPQVVVNGYVPPNYVVNQYVTVPAVYNNGGYTAYPYSQQYYPQIEQIITSLFGVPVQYANGYYVPQNVNSYNGYPYYTNNGYPYSNGYPYYNNNNYANYNGCSNGDEDGDEYNTCGYDTSYYQQTPYDNCMWTTDAYGNSYCAQSTQYDSYNGYPYGNAGYGSPYGNYGGYNPLGGNYAMYGLQQVQGIVVAKTGPLLMVLGTNGLKPIIVNDSFAQQNGYTMNGPVATGQVIDAYGFYNGNTFVATALM